MADGDRINIGQTNNASNPGAQTLLRRVAGSTRTDPVFTVQTPVGGDGIHGEASGNRTGVQGTSVDGTGVHGESTNSDGEGVKGTNNSGGVGVRGISDRAGGVVGRSTNGIGGFFNGGTAQLMLQPSSTAGRPTTGQHTKGELFMASGGALFVCTADGTPGTWRRFSTTPA